MQGRQQKGVLLQGSVLRISNANYVICKTILNKKHASCPLNFPLLFRHFETLLLFEFKETDGVLMQQDRANKSEAQ